MHSSNILTELEYAIRTRSGETGAILHQVTDLFFVNVGSHSVDQLNLYDDVFSKLVETIETKARAEFSRRLAPIDSAPKKTIRHLALDDDISVAEPVLAQSNVLDDDTLVQCAATKGQGHLLAIATRGTLSEKVSDQLVIKGEKQVLGVLVSNRGARISDVGFKCLVQKSVGDDWLSEAVGLRQDIPEPQFRDLVHKASAAVIRRLKAANPRYGGEIEEVINTTIATDRSKHFVERRDFSAAELIVIPLAKSEKLTEEVVREFAEARKVEEVIVAIAQLSNLPLREIERLIMETWSGPTVCVFKAIGFHLKTLEAIYSMRLPKGEPRRDDFGETKKAFLNLSRNTAERIIRFYKARQFGTRETDKQRALH